MSLALLTELTGIAFWFSMFSSGTGLAAYLLRNTKIEKAMSVFATILCISALLFFALIIAFFLFGLSDLS